MSVDNSAETTDGEALGNKQIDRRGFIQGVGVVGAALVVGTGTAAAEVPLDYDAPLAPETELRSTAVREEIDLSEIDDVLSMGDDESLSSDALMLREPFDSDGEEASNPVGVSLMSVDGADRELLDGSLMDAAEWTGDEIVESTDTEEPAEGDLAFDGEGVASFELDEPLSVSSTETAQLLFSSEVVSGDSAEVRLIDSEGVEEISLTIDPDGEEEEAGIVSVEESVSGAFAQVTVEDLSEELDDIETVEVELVGDATLDVSALDVGSEVELGEREVVVEEETDDDETEEVVDLEAITSHDGGLMWVESLDALGSRFTGAVLSDVEVELTQRSRDLEAELAYREEVSVPEEELDETVSGKETRLRAVANHYLPELDGISFEVDDLVYRGVPEEPTERYEIAGYSPDESTSVSQMSEALELTLSSVVDDITEEEAEENRHVSDLDAAEYEVGDYLVTVIDVGLTSEEFDELEDSAFFGFAGSGGGDGFLDGARGVILTIAGIAGAGIAWARARASNAASRVGGS